MYLRVQNAYIAGRKLKEISEFLNRDFVCTRLMHNNVLSVPTLDNVFELGDEILIVSAEVDAQAIQAFIWSRDRGRLARGRPASTTR